MYFVQHLIAPGWSRDTEDFALGIKGHIVGKIKYGQLSKEEGREVQTVHSWAWCYAYSVPTSQQGILDMLGGCRSAE